jgi:hypothetical protein
MTEEIYNKFLKQVEISDSCWIWTGQIHKSGYGCLRHKGKFFYAHKFSKEYSLGRIINPGYECCHSCYNKLCVNPSHIREDTRKSNIIDNVLTGNHNTVKLTVEDVKSIRNMAILGKSDKEISELFNVCRRNINQIRRYKSWKYV